MKKLALIITVVLMSMIITSTALAESNPACSGLLKALESIPPDSPGYDKLSQLAQEANCDGILDGNLDDRNAYEKGGSGIALVDSVAEGGIIRVKSLQAFGLRPSHEYYVWYLIQDAGKFDPNLQISPNFFRSPVTSNTSGNFAIAGSFPGPAAPLSPGTYRVDIFVTFQENTAILDSVEANLIRSAYLGTLTPLAGYDLLLSSTPFSTGIEVTVPS